MFGPPRSSADVDHLHPRWAIRILLLAAALALVASACASERVTVPTTPEAPGGAERPEGGQPPPASADEIERQMERAIFDLVNAERRARDLDELEWDDQLAGLARSWSQEMATDEQLRHQDAELMLERSKGFVGVGENIFRATGAAPASTIHVGWMRSDGHRANVLREDFDRLGVGVLCTGDGGVWATQRFGQTTGSRDPQQGEIPPGEPIVAEEGQGPRCP